MGTAICIVVIVMVIAAVILIGLASDRREKRRAAKRQRRFAIDMAKFHLTAFRMPHPHASVTDGYDGYISYIFDELRGLIEGNGLTFEEIGMSEKERCQYLAIKLLKELHGRRSYQRHKFKVLCSELRHDRDLLTSDFDRVRQLLQQGQLSPADVNADKVEAVLLRPKP